MTWLDQDGGVDRVPPPGAVDGAPRSEVADELALLSTRPLREHPAVFQRLHERLHAALAAIDV